MESEQIRKEQKELWEAAFRGSTLSAIMSKHVQYVGFADRRAQGIITINAFLIPLALAAINHPHFGAGAPITILTGLVSIIFAVWSLYPKNYASKYGKKNLFHFSQIGKFSEEEYMKMMREATSDNRTLTEMVSRDLYHLSRYVLKPKFALLRASYFIFVAGNVTAVLLACAPYLIAPLFA
jgi:hypothetical protein